jgi:hypothetical protein
MMFQMPTLILDLDHGCISPVRHPANRMKLKSTLAIVLLLLVTACKDFPGADGRYATPGRGGWDNFRAGTPSSDGGLLATAPRATD